MLPARKYPVAGSFGEIRHRPGNQRRECPGRIASMGHARDSQCRRRRESREDEPFAGSPMSAIFRDFSKNLILVEILCDAIILTIVNRVEP